MKLHANARLSLKGRELLIDRVLSQGWSLAQVADAAGISERTACKWVARFRLEGGLGLFDRPSAPRRSPSRTSEERLQVIAALRRLRMTGTEIAECLGMAVTTVSGIPILSRIPWIGGILFGNTQKTVTANELYLFLTPHVVSSDEDIDRLREATKSQSALLEETNIKARIVPKGDTLQIGEPIRKPADPPRPSPDSAAKRPPEGAR